VVTNNSYRIKRGEVIIVLCVWTSEKAITKNCAGPNHLFHNIDAKAANCPPIAPSSVLNRKKKKNREETLFKAQNLMITFDHLSES